MGKCIAKLAEDEYVEWSTVVDAPVTYVLTRDEMEAHLRDEYGRSHEAQIPDRLDRCDQIGHSARWPGAGSSVEGLIAGNRAGEDEGEATLEQIRELYRAPG